MQGWIKIYRQMIDWEWYKDTNVKVLFIHLLLLANHTEKKWKGYIIKRGQTITSYGHLAEDIGLSKQQIRTAMRKLENTKEITHKATRKNLLITIENYEKFQTEENESNTIDNTMITSLKHDGNTIVTTTKNEKKEKNKKNEEKNILLCDKFEKPTIEEIREYIFLKDYDVDAEWFYNYYEANGWKVGRNKMKSWKACLSTWNQRAKKEQSKNKPNYQNYEQRKYHDLNSLYANITKEF